MINGGLGRLGKVSGDEFRSHSALTAGGEYFFGFLSCLSSVNDDILSRSCKRFRNLTPDSLRGAGNECGMSFEINHE